MQNNDQKETVKTAILEKWKQKNPDDFNVWKKNQ